MKTSGDSFRITVAHIFVYSAMKMQIRQSGKHIQSVRIKDLFLFKRHQSVIVRAAVRSARQQII